MLHHELPESQAELVARICAYLREIHPRAGRLGGIGRALPYQPVSFAAHLPNARLA